MRPLATLVAFRRRPAPARDSGASAPTPSPLGWTGSLALAAGLIILVAIGGTSVWLAWRNRDGVAVAAHANQVRTNVIGLVGSLVDAETGQRGFLLTGKPEYLQPFINAAQRLPGQIKALDQEASHNPALAAPMAVLRQAIPDELRELSRTIDLVRSGERDAALAVVDTGRGQADMDAIRAAVDQIAQAEQQTVDARGGEIARRGRSLIVIDAAGALMLVAVAGIVWLVIRRAIRAAQSARAAAEIASRQLEQANETLEETVRQRTADLVEANEEVQRFAYIVSHDLRAPLVNIMGFTSELEAATGQVVRFIDGSTGTADGAVPEDVVTAVRSDVPEAIRFIKASTAKMDRLIAAILRLSREGRRVLAPEPIAMRELLGEITASLQHQAEEKVAEITIGALPDVVGDRLAIEQVFSNLLENALKYLKPNEPGRIEVTGRAHGRFAFFEIRDNGRGIAPKDHGRIFELFRRAGDQTVPGEGIGLAHVKTLVRRLGGRIDCESALGAGSTFRVILPLGETQPKGAAA